MYAAGKDSARPAESDDGNSNKYKKPKYFVQTSRKYCNKHDIPVGYDKHGLCSLCDCVDSNVGKTTNRKFYGVRQSYCTPWIPQDIPLKKKTRELPQVKISIQLRSSSSTLQSQSTMRCTIYATIMVVFQIKIIQEQLKNLCQ